MDFTVNKMFKCKNICVVNIYYLEVILQSV